MTLTLNDENLKQLDAFLGEIPSKYSLQVILYLNQINQAQQKAAADNSNAEVSQAPKPLKAVPAETN